MGLQAAQQVARPKFGSPMFGATIVLFENFSLDNGGIFAEVQATEDGRVELVIRQVPTRVTLLRIAITPEDAKKVGHHLDKAGWAVDPAGVACGCGGCAGR